MITAFLIGRFIFGLYWLMTAYNHLFNSAGLIGYSQSKGVRSAKLAVIGSGILALIGSLTILSGVWTVYGIIALIIFLVGVSFKMHAFWKETDPMAKMNDKIQFEKNMALVGALLMFLAIATPWNFAL